MPRLLDLFCGAGGAAVGYHRAGFDVVVIGVYGDHPEDSVIHKGHPARRARDVGHAQQALGIDWTDSWAELKEAIPPAYTELIGHQLMQHLRAAA